MPGNRSTAERQRGVDGPVNRSPRSRRAARAGPADGSSRRCIDRAWFWFSSGSRACADKRRCGKDNGRSSSGYVQQPARLNTYFWFDCSDFLVRILPCYNFTNEFRRSGFRLSEKDGEFLSRGRFQGHRKFGWVGRTAELSIHERHPLPVCQFAGPRKRVDEAGRRESTP